MVLAKIREFLPLSRHSHTHAIFKFAQAVLHRCYQSQHAGWRSGFRSLHHLSQNLGINKDQKSNPDVMRIIVAVGAENETYCHPSALRKPRDWGNRKG